MRILVKPWGLCLAIAAAAYSSGGAMAASAPNFDGSYTGAGELAPSAGTFCPKAMPISAKVTDGTFRFALRADQEAVVRIKADGTYSATLPGSLAVADKHMLMLPRIDGRADGHTLAGDYGTRWCWYSYRLDRDGTTEARR